MYRSRIAAATIAISLLCLEYQRERSRTVEAAARQADPAVIWSIGTPDNSGDEFAAGVARALTYTCGKSSPLKDWRQRQDGAEESPSVYSIHFGLDQQPSPAVLSVDGFYIGFAPRAMVVEVNGKRGWFRVSPVGGPDLDERQANFAIHARQSFRIPMDASLFRRGSNQIGLSFLGESGSFYYDALSLRRTDAAPPALNAAVEPTIFFPRHGDQIMEIVQISVNHQVPLGKASVSLKVGSGPAIRKEWSDEYHFGEHLLELEIPAPATDQSYQLNVTADGKTYPLSGVLHPGKALAHLRRLQDSQRHRLYRSAAACAGVG